MSIQLVDNPLKIIELFSEFIKKCMNLKKIYFC